MQDSTAVCRKITDLMPEVGTCWVDLNFNYDDRLQTWRFSYDEEGRQP